MQGKLISAKHLNEQISTVTMLIFLNFRSDTKPIFITCQSLSPMLGQLITIKNQSTMPAALGTIMFRAQTLEICVQDQEGGNGDDMDSSSSTLREAIFRHKFSDLQDCRSNHAMKFPENVISSC